MGNLLLVKRTNFNLDRAELDEWYELWEHRRNWRGKVKVEPICTYYGDMASIPYRGDKKWAERIAKHYKITMPGEDTN